MATPPRQRSRSEALHALSSPAEKRLQRIERNSTADTLEELLDELRQVEPDAYRDVPPPATAATCTDRAARIELLAERAALGIGLFGPDETVHLDPEDGGGGRHHGRHRRRRHPT